MESNGNFMNYVGHAGLMILGHRNLGAAMPCLKLLFI
jgi:hypothetical protein